MRIELFAKAIALAAVFVSCSSESLDLMNDSIANETTIRRFSSSEEVVFAVNNYSSSIKTKSCDDGFVSYLETVMSEPGYEELPYAIQSRAFGSLLNQNGELVFGDNLLHVSHYGILFGPYENREEIRNLAENDELPSLCNKNGNYAPLSNSDFFIIDGYKDIYLYDTFGCLGPNDLADTITRASIVSYSATVNRIFLYSTSEELLFRWQDKSNSSLWHYNWNRTFTQPSAGEQKQVFPDGKHCNDTKIYHQDYGIATDTGLKTKTMKKRALGYWDKVNGDMEAGFVDVSVFESFPSGLSGQGDCCVVFFGGKPYTVKNVNVADHSMEYYLSSATWQSIESACSTYHVDAVRYIDYIGKEAVTLFPNRTSKGNVKSFEMSFTVPFGGISTGPGYNDGKFHVLHQKIFGLTIINNVIRGTEIIYNYNEL